MTVTQHPRSPHSLALERVPDLHLHLDTPKGRGVFTRSFIPSGTVVDTCPVLVLDPEENKRHVEKTSMYHYTYNWPTTDRSGKALKTQAVVFGLGSMFNHSSRDQNVGWQRDVERHVILYRALRDIRAGEELCISYGSHLTFQDADEPERGAMGEKGDDENDLLQRIQLE